MILEPLGSSVLSARFQYGLDGDGTVNLEHSHNFLVETVESRATNHQRWKESAHMNRM